MPKLVRKPVSFAGWLVISALLLGYLYAFYRAPWIVGALSLAIAIATWISTRNHKVKLTAMAALRKNDSICTFARAFDTHEVDTWVIRAVYEQLRAYLHPAYPHFPVRAEDRLEGGLIDDPDDLELDLATEIAERTGRPLEQTENNPYFGKVETVRDLVLFFNTQPRSSGHSSGL